MLYMEPIHLVARPQHPLLRQERALDWGDLMAYRWLVWPRGTPIRNALEGALAAAGHALPQGSVESNSVTLNLTLLGHSDMIGMASHHAALRFSHMGALDVLRALAREPEAAAALLQDFADAAAGEPRILPALRPLRDLLALPPEQLEPLGRRLVQHLVLVAQACLLRRHAPHAVADAFAATRLEDGGAGRVAGAIDPRAVDIGAILERAFPA
ncbi:hypothetical protein AVHM3334_14715 [Acidovorax sp. SUPP3334]|nr:hypothetical protein AVHM3334_14715 [Acidovorax sp. SUPP3334]